MKTYKVTGTITKIGEAKTFASGFVIRPFTVDVSDSNYRNLIEFTLKKDKIGLIDGYRAGEPVTVTFTIDGRQFNDRIYNDLTVWQIERDGLGAAVVAPTAQPAAAKPAGAAAKAATWADVVAAWQVNHANDKAGLQAICGETCPEILAAAKSTGAKFIDVAAQNRGTFEKILAKIAERDAAPKDDDDFGDLPF